MRILAVSLMTVLLTTATYAEPSLCVSSTGKSVSVHGVANVHLRPDRVSFSVGVETRAAGVAEAFKANTVGVNAVLAALKQKGVTPEEVQTSSFDITTEPATKAHSRRFKVGSLVTVTRSETSSVGDLLQAAVGAGANQAGDLRFFVADPTGSRQHGLELAFQDARSRAEALAALSKKTLADVLCVSDQSVYPDEGMLSRGRSFGDNETPIVEAGVEEMTFSVSVVFELK